MLQHIKGKKCRKVEKSHSGNRKNSIHNRSCGKRGFAHTSPFIPLGFWTPVFLLYRGCQNKELARNLTFSRQKQTKKVGFYVIIEKTDGTKLDYRETENFLPVSREAENAELRKRLVED